MRPGRVVCGKRYALTSACHRPILRRLARSARVGTVRKIVGLPIVHSACRRRGTRRRARGLGARVGSTRLAIEGNPFVVGQASCIRLQGVRRVFCSVATITSEHKYLTRIYTWPVVNLSHPVGYATFKLKAYAHSPPAGADLHSWRSPSACAV